MRKILLFLLFSSPSLVLAQVVMGQIDDFEDYTIKNWTKNNTIPNVNIYDDGPLGAGDNFLRVTSSGTGNNLKLMTKNNAQWMGHYYQGLSSTQIKYISMDVRNSGSNVILLRLAFQTDYGIYYRGCTTNAIAVLPNQGWHRISFSILTSNITALTDPYNYAILFGFGSQGVNEMRILHSSVPSWEAEPIVATLDIDNIMAESQPLDTEDFENKSELKLFPNPTNNIISIYSDKNIYEGFEYEIFDLVGRAVKNGNSKINENIIVQDLDSGNYIIQIKTDNGELINKKFTKK